jgi:hypothetical protein
MISGGLGAPDAPLEMGEPTLTRPSPSPTRKLTSAAPSGTKITAAAIESAWEGRSHGLRADEFA